MVDKSSCGWRLQLAAGFCDGKSEARGWEAEAAKIPSIDLRTQIRALRFVYD